ncbi:MAG TPA: response regulator transcription factor [Nocardioidaceae bacterium]|nr:response regulator transcription factor [Nocardioidaceae bacterium]
MRTEPDLLAEAAQDAVAAGDWAAARDALAVLAAREPSAQTLADLGDVLWWLGETDEAVGYSEQAYAAFRRRGDSAASARIAVGLYLIYRVSLGNVAAARGWLARMARLVAESDLAALEGWVRLLRAHDTNDPVIGERLATDARNLAARFGDSDLELCALSQLGASLVRQGRSQEGTRLLDEAMAASLAGESTRPHTVVYTSCTLISACAETADLDHALQWIRAAETFERRYGNPHLYTTCRTYLGAILFASGDWAGAEGELRAALDIGVSAEPAVCAEAAARLAELRLAQGRLEEAERLLEGFEEFETSSLSLAELAQARGDLAGARRIALRRVHALDGSSVEQVGSYRPGLAACLEEGALWELLAQMPGAAESDEALRRLAGLASSTGCDQLLARALRASGGARSDLPSLERALGLFVRLRLPLEAARTRLALAALLTGDDAVAEARAAMAAFEMLGAARDADASAARLRGLGVAAARGGPAGLGELTQREREVLDLLGEGLSNRELADRLFLSRKTVERHVRNVLFKLGLRNRTEAAAYVIRHGAGMRSMS